jgi:hypothetical protein
MLDESGSEAAFVRNEKARCTSHGKISPVKTRNGVETTEEKVVPSVFLQSKVLHVGACHPVRPRPRT